MNAAEKHEKRIAREDAKMPKAIRNVLSPLGSKIKVPRQRVLHVSWSEGYRTGTTFHFILECGHTSKRAAARGKPRTTQCFSCWRIAVCDANGCSGCAKCSKHRAQLGTAEAQIAKYA